MHGKITLRKNEERRIVKGHLWVFSNEIQTIESTIQSGDLVEVLSSEGKSLGVGFYNKRSLIAVRMLSKTAQELETIITAKVREAYALRKTLYPTRDSYRLIYSEGDFLPGLIVDKYGDTGVLQFNSLGVYLHRELIADVLVREVGFKNLFTKNDNYFLGLEGIPEGDFVLRGELVNLKFSDGSITYNISPTDSQKTGFYFDQSDNRYFVERIVKDADVLDCFSNVGGFGMHALKAGAQSVVFNDSSETVLTQAKNHLVENGLSGKTEFIVSDTFDLLERFIAEKKMFDVVMIDPPAFIKNKKSLITGRKAYEKLNRDAINVVEPGGYLVTSSCSYHLSEPEFYEAVRNASGKAGKTLQLIWSNSASLDHPRHPFMEESQYLKFAVYRVM